MRNSKEPCDAMDESIASSLNDLEDCKLTKFAISLP